MPHGPGAMLFDDSDWHAALGYYDPDTRVRTALSGQRHPALYQVPPRVEKNHSLRTRRRAFGPHFWASLLGLTAAAGARGLPCK